MALTHISGFELDKNNETPSEWLASAKTHMDLSYIHPIYLHKNITNITFLKRWFEDLIHTKIESDIYYNKCSVLNDIEWRDNCQFPVIRDGETPSD
ncbi:hypothetical protein Glove_661g53 [Diversispora epigaea]|uniref:Uncharacterized protein n=1 Tax=Diversispora epigaea TaxID=1348612 RepID=A0A397GC74_9GLOM|nr:hypothetical protein Glove_661g53 [Diversispora epigaea]